MEPEVYPFYGFVYNVFMIDNFDQIRSKLTFCPITEIVTDKTGKQVSHTYDVDQYEIHVLRRVKDCKALGKKVGANECTRLLRTYQIDSLEKLDNKREAIKELCETNNARAYVLLQVRDMREVLMNLEKNIIECLAKKNYGVKIEHLARVSFCELKSSRYPVWMLDIDNDEMHGWTKEEIISILKENLKTCGKDPKKLYIVPTKNGFHIVSEPFNTLAAQKACPMIFKDQQTGYVLECVKAWFAAHNIPWNPALDKLERNPFMIQEVEESYIDAFKSKKLYEDTKLLDSLRKSCKKDFPGWLHKDATTLLYAP